MLFHLALLAKTALLLCHFQSGDSNNTMRTYAVVGRRISRNGGGSGFVAGFAFARDVPQRPSSSSFRHRGYFSTDASENETRRRRGSAPSSHRHLSNRTDNEEPPLPLVVKSAAIVGGGLAGLSTAYHLLDVAGKEEKDAPRRVRITVYDKADVGEGGASSVAGG